MADANQAPLSGQPHSKAMGKVRVVQVFKVNSIEEVEDRVKSEIWRSSCIPGRLVAIQIARGSSGESKYRVEWVLETSQAISLQAFDRKVTLYGRVKAEESLSAFTAPIYANNDSIVQVEVFEAKFEVPAVTAVIKVYHCGFANINYLIQEALLQMRLASTYTCELFDLYIRKSSKNLFEVGLVMERLEGDLAVSNDVQL